MGNKAVRSKSHLERRFSAPSLSSPSSSPIRKRKRIISTVNSSNTKHHCSASVLHTSPTPSYTTAADVPAAAVNGATSTATATTLFSFNSSPSASPRFMRPLQNEGVGSGVYYCDVCHSIVGCSACGGGCGGSGGAAESNYANLDDRLTKGELINELCSGKKVCATDFELLKVIGRGSFGKVMQVRHKETSKIYAMKTMRKGNIIAKNQVAHTKDEKHILQRIKHPFIVNLNYAFQTKDKLYMILDYVNGGELFWHLKKEGSFGEERSRFYAAEIATALFHLHQNGIIYRDLKPENILLDSEGHIVITDFGLSKEIKDSHTHTFCGTPEYIAPELLLGTGHSYPVDWWSLGTLVYEMITGLPPFYSEDKTQMYNMILNNEIMFPDHMSDESCDFLIGMLEKKPEDRLTPPEIQEHPWFRGLDWEALAQKKLKPPWKPMVNGIMDTSQIDPQLLGEPPNSLDTKGPMDLSEGDENLFAGFTYEGVEVGSALSGDSTKINI